MSGRGAGRWAAALTSVLALTSTGRAQADGAAARSRPPDELARARVVFARGTSLWLTDGRGKAAAVELATLPGPATAVRLLRTDATGRNVLVDVDGQWSWFPLPTDGQPAQPRPLPCAAGPARFSWNARYVLCAAPSGQAQLVRLRDGRLFPRDAPAAGASLIEHDGVRELVWTDGTTVSAAPLSRPTATRVLAPTAPLRGFLAAPDGSRGVGVYRDRPKKPKDAPERDQLFGFALDGTAARRRLIRDGVVIDWSWDARWLLIQDGTKACIARATGGQFKCWKGYTAVSLAPDGAWALVLGPRAGADEAGDKGRDEPAATGSGESASGEGGEEHDEADDGTGVAPKGPQSLFRAKLSGPYTERPALVETIVDGAALWLPDPTAPAPTPPTTTRAAPPMPPAPAPSAPAPSAPAPTTPAAP